MTLPAVNLFRKDKSDFFFRQRCQGLTRKAPKDLLDPHTVLWKIDLADTDGRILASSQRADKCEMHCKMKEGIVFKRSQQLMDLLGLPHFPLFIFLRKRRDLGNLINVVSLLCCW